MGYEINPPHLRIKYGGNSKYYKSSLLSFAVDDMADATIPAVTR